MPRTSEFGAGFVYNLVLFAKHYESAGEFYRASKTGAVPTIMGGYSLWFNGAGDHFYELEIPKGWEKRKVGRLALSLKNQALHFRLS